MPAVWVSFHTGQGDEERGMRRHGSVWRWAWLLGAALLCLYIAFDVLDVDGSRLPFARAAVLAETDAADAERQLRTGLLPEPLRFRPDILAAERALWLQRPVAHSSPPRADRALPPRRLVGRSTHVPAASADPA
jgi:hypothetical protein